MDLSLDDPEENMNSFAYDVANRGYRGSFTKRWPDSITHLIKACWDSNPNRRPMMKDVVERIETYYQSLESESITRFGCSGWCFCGGSKE